MGVLIRRKESQFRRQFDNTILFISCQIYTECLICTINAPYSISCQRVSVSAACVEHDSRYTSYLNACVCTKHIRLDTYKPNLYWYSVVYCGSPCLSVCLSVFLLPVHLSVFLSVSVRPSVCPSDSYPLYDFHNFDRKHFIFWYGNSP